MYLRHLRSRHLSIGVELQISPTHACKARKVRITKQIWRRVLSDAQGESDGLAKCEATHLARQTIAYFDLPKVKLDGVQLLEC
jgi:hypothetical protein